METTADTSRYQILPLYLKIVFWTLSASGIVLITVYICNIASVAGKFLLTYHYYYLFMSLFCACGFLILPARRKEKRIPWYDLVGAALSLGIAFYFFLHAWEIQLVGWYPATTPNFILALIFCPLVLELARRVNPIFAAICLVVGLLPVFADRLPGVLSGIGFSFSETIALWVYGSEGLLGIPLRAMAGFLAGFIIFAGILVASGAGNFFLSLALALLGRFRGGPAKVAVVASGFFGSLSGSGISNIAATGSFTIPAMKRMGYPPHYAAAIEACASSGGIIMPPVMGVIAFIMAVMLDIPYATIMVAAAIPAIFYYFGLLMQVDAYAGRVGLKGLPREEIPSIIDTLKKGWVFIFVLIFLVWGLVYMRWEAISPFYASGLMLILSFNSKETMMTPKRILETISAVGKLLTQTTAIMLPIGFVVGALLISGAATSLTAGLIRIAGGNVFIILLMGAVICYILGMGGLVIASYIFLSVTMAPAVIEIAGLNPLAVHLFIVWYAITAGITPPVAAGSFFAAAMAGADPMKTGFLSMRLAIVIYFIPFFFVFNPSLILQGPLLETLYWFVLGLMGIFFIAEGMEGYLLKLGKLRLYERPLLVIAGILFAYPEWKTTVVGAALGLLTVTMIALRSKLAVAPKIQ